MSVYYKKTERNDLGSVVENIFSDFNVNPTGTVFLKPNFSGRPPILGG